MAKSLVFLGLMLIFSCDVIKPPVTAKQERSSREQPQQETIPKNDSIVLQNVNYVRAAIRPVNLEVQLTGTAQASNEAQVRSTVEGRVVEQFFTAGTFVFEGMELYRISSTDQELAYERSLALLQRRQAELEQAEAAANEVDALVDLGESNVLQLRQAQAKVRQAEANVRLAQLRVQEATVSWEGTTIRAPIGGFIGDVSAVVGSYVSPIESKPLAIIRVLNPIHVVFENVTDQVRSLTSELFQAATTGATNTLSVTINSKGPEENIQKVGSVQTIQINDRQNKSSITMLASFENSQYDLLPGQKTQATVRGDAVNNVIVIPQVAVVTPRENQPMVWVIDKEEDRVNLRRIEVGAEVGEGVIVTNGLDLGERVAIDNLDVLESAMRVNPIEQVPAEQEGDETPSGQILAE